MTPDRQYIEYSNPFEYPDVEVLIEGEWLPGEVSAQRQEDDGSWRCRVQYYLADSQGRAGGWFPAEQIRRDTVDRSYGRTT